MASKVDNPVHSSSKTGQSTDSERGRKRRRSSANLPPASHSANLRGRVRRRSVSPSTTQGTPEKKSRIKAAKSPSRKFQKRSTEFEQIRKRSQSPSRSRCAGDKKNESPPRRRQRTTSRSRKHDEDSDNEIEDGDTNKELKEDDAEDVAVED